MTAPIPTKRRLADFQNLNYRPGRGIFVRGVWYYVSLLLMENGWLPFSGLKVVILRLFGARIGRGVVIRSHVRIKFPWRLRIGNNCWIGQEVWIDNLADVEIDNDVCISQGAYLCTGSHDHRSETFDLKIGPIIIHGGAWICCRATILGHSKIAPMEVVPAGTVFSRRELKSHETNNAT